MLSQLQIEEMVIYQRMIAIKHTHNTSVHRPPVSAVAVRVVKRNLTALAAFAAKPRVKSYMRSS